MDPLRPDLTPAGPDPNDADTSAGAGEGLDGSAWQAPAPPASSAGPSGTGPIPGWVPPASHAAWTDPPPAWGQPVAPVGPPSPGITSGPGGTGYGAFGPGFGPGGYEPATPAGGPWTAAQPRRPRIGLSIALVMVLALAFFAGLATDRAMVEGGPAPTPPPGVTLGPSEPPAFKTLWEAYNILTQHYVDRAALDPTKLAYGATQGMVNAVGDTGHTRFLTPDDVAAAHQSLSGSITGIGARMEQVDSDFVVQSVVPDSPAQKAGLRAGDKVISVDGASVAGKTLDQVVGSIRGDAGTTVKLEVTRGDATPIVMSIVRAKISVAAVSWAMVPGTKTADVRIEEFSKGVADDLKKALLDADAAGATAVVLDLRDNPGGYVDEAIGVASMFIPSGTIYEERDATGTTRAIPRTDVRATDIPLAVLVNLGSASASEIVSGALQDSGRARIYGQTTFGTGTVLNEFSLSDGSALLVGTVEWLTPKGREIWHHGISPDVAVTLATTAHVLTPDEISSNGASAVTSANDAQLKAAVDAISVR